MNNTNHGRGFTLRYTDDNGWVDEKLYSHKEFLKGEPKTVALMSPKVTGVLELKVRRVNKDINLEVQYSSLERQLWIKSAFLSWGTMLIKCIANYLDVEVSEFSMSYCKSKNTNNNKVEPTVYFVEKLENGAGYTTHIGSSSDIIRECIFESMDLTKSDYVKHLMDEKHANSCDASCYDCLQDYYNKDIHLLLDWRLGLDVSMIARHFHYVPSLKADYWKPLIKKTLDTMILIGAIKSYREVNETWVVETEVDRFFLVHPLWSDVKISRLAEAVDMTNNKARVLRDFHLETVC